MFHVGIWYFCRSFPKYMFISFLMINFGLSSLAKTHQDVMKLVCLTIDDTEFYDLRSKWLLKNHNFTELVCTC